MEQPGRPSNRNRVEYNRTAGAIRGTLDALIETINGEQALRIRALMRLSFTLGHLYTLLEQEEFSNGQS